MLHYDVEILDRPDNGCFLNTHSGKSLRQTIRYLFQSALDKELQGVQTRVRLIEPVGAATDDGEAFGV